MLVYCHTMKCLQGLRAKRDNVKRGGRDKKHAKDRNTLSTKKRTGARMHTKTHTGLGHTKDKNTCESKDIRKGKRHTKNKDSHRGQRYIKNIDTKEGEGQLEQPMNQF